MLVGVGVFFVVTRRGPPPAASVMAVTGEWRALKLDGRVAVDASAGAPFRLRVDGKTYLVDQRKPISVDLATARQIEVKAVESGAEVSFRFAQ